jgi:histidinol-phosphatase
VNQDLELALQLADAADARAMQVFGTDNFSVERKADGSPVTDIDREIEATLRKLIAERFPGDGIIGEEFDATNPGAPRQWILDPIDGTKAFMRGNENWATLIALRVDGNVVVGVASAPAMDQRYTAVAGEGASVNGAPISTSAVDDISDAMLSHTSMTGFTRIDEQEKLEALALRCWDSRGAGNSFTHLSVARGSADIGWTSRAHVWDYAALSLIVREAGGEFYDGSRPGVSGPGISANVHLYEAALAAAGVQETHNSADVPRMSATPR